MTLGTNGFRWLITPVDSAGNAVAVTFDAVKNLYRLAVDASTTTVRLGDEAPQIMTPALPNAGDTATTPELDMAGMTDVLVGVFADQPFDVMLADSYTAGGIRRISNVLFSGVANEERTELIIPVRRFFQVVVRNTGGAAMTILEVTVTRRR